MADIAIDTEVTLNAAQAFKQAAQTLEDNTIQAQRASDGMYSAGNDGTYMDAFDQDYVAFNQQLKEISAQVQEIALDLERTVETFRGEDVTSFNYFTAATDLEVQRIEAQKSKINELKELRQEVHQKLQELKKQLDDCVKNSFLGLGLNCGVFRNQIRELEIALRRIDYRIDRGFKDLADYVGQENWHLISMDNFSQSELVEQDGGSCTIYGMMNTLITSGIDLANPEGMSQQAVASRIIDQFGVDPADFQPLPSNLSQQEMADWIYEVVQKATGEKDGFDISAAERIAQAYGVSYQSGDFKEWLFGVDEQAAEQFLIDTVQQGKPIYVSTQVDDSFGAGGGGHAYTVLGVETDESGRITNVLVSTNWGIEGIGENDIWEVPFDDFSDDWFNRRGARYIVLE